MMLPMTHVILNFHVLFFHAIIKTHPYRGNTNNTRRLIFFMIFPWLSQKRLRTTTLQMTRVFSCFRSILNESHENGSVPRCYKWQNLSACFIVFPMKSTKTARYRDATTNARHLIFFAIFPLSSPKRLGTMMLQIKDLIYLFHVIS